MTSCDCGDRAYLVQYDKPNWKPLLDAAGERLTEGFMWMHEAELEDGLRLHAYKHIHTRRYLYLTAQGEARQATPCDRFAWQRLDFALEAAICSWWLLAGWTEEDAQALKDAISKVDFTLPPR